MWILPKQLIISPSVQDTEESALDLKELSEISVTSLMWRSKPSQSQTWLQRWKRVSWMRALSGRILKHSISQRIVDEWTSSQAATHASRSALQERGEELKTKDTFSRILQRESQQLDLDLFSLKTSKDTCLKGSAKYKRAYELWVTQLRQEYSVRLKSEHRTREKDCSSLAWQTPRARNPEDCKSERARNSPALASQVLNWGTPNTMDYLPERSPEALKRQFETSRKGRTRPANLREQVNFPTPQASEAEKYRLTGDSQAAKCLSALAITGHLDQTKNNTNGKNQEPSQRVLNPRWVEQLMGLPVGWTSLECWEME